jgi:triacylglycerol lipase
MTPVVLHHGLLGGGMGVGSLQWCSFRGIDRMIAERGYPVFVSAVHPTAGVEKRALQLRKWLLTFVHKLDEPIILIAHSLGGLDARYMLTRLEMSPHVAALATISTPHRGTALADWVVEHIGRRLRGLQWAEKLGLEVGAATDLTTERCAIFNQQIPNVPGVKYFSVSASRPGRLMPPFAIFSHSIIFKAEGPNDGLVSVRSAKWGTYLGNWRADHWQTVNRKYSWRKRHQPIHIVENYLALLETITANLPARGSASGPIPRRRKPSPGS